jgi:hypothetical protein
VADEGFAVVAAVLSRHSGADDAAGDAVAQAADAATQAALNPLAYGIICQLLPMVLQPLQLLAASSIKDEADALHAAGSLLRELALQYENTDADLAKTFRDLAAQAGITL